MGGATVNRGSTIKGVFGLFRRITLLYLFLDVFVNQHFGEMLLLGRHKGLGQKYYIGFKSCNIYIMNSSSKDKSPKATPFKPKGEKNANQHSLPPKKSKNQQKSNSSNRPKANTKQGITNQLSPKIQSSSQQSLEEYLIRVDQVNQSEEMIQDLALIQKKKNIQNLIKASSNQINHQLGEAFDNLIENNITANIQDEEQLESLDFKQQSDGDSIQKQGSQSSRKSYEKPNTSVKLPIDKLQSGKITKYKPTSSRSIVSQMSKNERQASIDLSKYDPNDLIKIVLGDQTKQTLMKLQKYDKQFSYNMNSNHLRGVFDAEQRRIEKIKSINRHMKPIAFDNELTIGFILNILKYQKDLNKDVMDKELLTEANEGLKSQINELKRSKNEEIKELKLSMKSKPSEDDNRNKGLDLEIKDFKKGNQVLVPAFKQGNYQRMKKVLESQIKKLGTGNKQMGFERKELLEIVLELIVRQDKSDFPRDRNTQIGLQEIGKLHSEIGALFNGQTSLEKNISQLQKTKRHLEPKIQDTKLFQYKDIYQTLFQGCSYMISVYHQLKQKNSQITSLNRKIADMDRMLERTDRLRTESIEKGDKIIEGLKDGLEKERRKSREIIKKFDEIGKPKESESSKEQGVKLPGYLEEWQGTLDGILNKLKEQEFSWISELGNIKKKFPPKFEDISYRNLFQKDIFLLQSISKKLKQLQKVEKLNEQLEKRVASYDKQLQFRPSDADKKYQIEKEKNEQLLSEKNALTKELKEIQKLSQKGKKPEVDEVISINKICYSIDSLLKVPFNHDNWNKIRLRFPNPSQLKYLHNITTTLESLFTRVITEMSRGKNKDVGLKKPVKELVKESQRTGCQQINQFLELLRLVIENELQLEAYIELVNYIPTLLALLKDKTGIRGQSGPRESTDPQTLVDGQGVSDLVIRSKIESRIEQGDVDKTDQIQMLSEDSRIIKKEAQESRISQPHQEINLQLSDIVHRTNYEAEYLRIKQQLQNIQSQTSGKLAYLQEELGRQTEKVYYQSKVMKQSEYEIKDLKVKDERLGVRVRELEQEIEELKREVALRGGEKGEVIETEASNVQLCSKQEIAERVEESQQTESAIIEQEKILPDPQALIQQIQSLRTELLSKVNLIEITQSTEQNLKKYIQSLEDQLNQQAQSQLPSTETLSDQSQSTKLNDLQNQNNALTKDIHELEITILQKDHEINNLYSLSEKYRLMFQGCCKQMEELHHNTQEEINSLTQMHTKNQSLLEDEIELLRKQKYGGGQFKETDIVAIEFERMVKQEQSRVAQLESLQIEMEALGTENSELRQNNYESGQEILRLRERITVLDRESIGSDNPLSKRNPKIRSRGSHKSNVSNSGCELSVKLTSLLEKEQKLTKSSLQMIIGAINKLISSNKKLIQRVKRTERENQALYEAINQITESEEQIGEGISIVGQLQDVLTNLVDWLDNEQIVTEEHLKLSHYFERLQDCLSKTNYVRYIEIFQEFIQNSIVVVYEKSQEQLFIQNRQIDTLKEKLVVALDQHLHNIINESQRETQREDETEGEGETKILNQVRILLSIYLKTMNIKVIEDLVAILNIEDISFG